MGCSWIEKNRSRNKIDWEHTKNDVSGVVSLFGGNLIHMSTIGGRCGLSNVDLWGSLATIVVVVASGTWWSVLNLLLVLVTLTSEVTHLATLVVDPKDSAGSRVVRWSWVERSRWTRHRIGWPRWVGLLEHAVRDPDSALLRARTGGTIIMGMLVELSGGVHVLRLDGLVDKGLEGGEVMKIQLTAKSRI